MKTLYLATNNKNKVKEFKQLFKNFEIKTPSDLGICFDPEETGSTFEENALIKARALNAIVNAPCVADDSGLCVDALGGAPGVFSARYSGGSDDDNIDLLLKNMEGKTNRKAKFVCAFAYVGNIEFTVRGECFGEILTERRGADNFGYDPVFLSDDLGVSFGECAPEKKNEVSHRARAVRALYEKLKGEGLL